MNKKLKDSQELLLQLKEERLYLFAQTKQLEED